MQELLLSKMSTRLEESMDALFKRRFEAWSARADALSRALATTAEEQ